MKPQEILTFYFKVGFAREIVAFTNNALVSSTVVHFRILNDQREYILINDESILFTFVAFL